jgi:predicted amidohydrolase YtcJ
LKFAARADSARRATGEQLHRKVQQRWAAVPCLAVLCVALQLKMHPAVIYSADTVIIHAKIYTENPRQPWAENLALKDGKVVAVGGDEVATRYKSAHAQIIDAGGRVVLPGFTDSHIHFLEGSIDLGRPDLNDAESPRAIEQILKKYRDQHPGAGWVIGQGWSYDAFGKTALPDKALLDAIFPDRPVYMESFDGHSGWVNSKALALAKIDRNTPDPPGGKIVRDAKTGEPTGSLVEDARHLAKNLLPMPTAAEKLAAFQKGLALAAENGLVRVHCAGETPDTFGDYYDVDLLDQIRRDGHLTARFYISKDVQPPVLKDADVAAIEQVRQKYNDDWISAGAAKFFLDGVMEDDAGAMLAPYDDQPGYSGTTQWDPEKYERAVVELDRHDIQIFTHAVGDRAVRIALDAYERAAKQNHTADERHRIEHIEVVSPTDIPRFAAQNVIASMQPLHAYPAPGVWDRRVGLEREKFAFAWNSLEKAGAHLAFGSDWDVVTLNPWPGVQTAVTRQNDKGWPEGGWIPDQRITVAQTIAAYTIGAAYAGHREKTEGSLAPGKVADLIIVSQNPFEVDPHELGNTKVLLTMVGGRVVYQRSPGVSITMPDSEAPQR